jgi:hypothetical protein
LIDLRGVVWIAAISEAFIAAIDGFVVDGMQGVRSEVKARNDAERMQPRKTTTQPMRTDDGSAVGPVSGFFIGQLPGRLEATVNFQ